MNKLFLTILMSLIIMTLSFAQQSPGSVIRDFQITGTVHDVQTDAPLEYATIVFYSPMEKKIVTGSITDAQGNFNISVPGGVYNISVEFIGFKTITMPNKVIDKNENLGTFNLVFDAEALAEVEVIAERTTVEIKLDKKIYNVGKDLTVRGGTVSDVLDNVPSVSVDVEGNVSLRGNDNVRILINGKPSGLVGLNSTDALRQLPAESIERVEVITSPSARYDAEGTAGILNIILRRSKLQGLNGAITVNAGHPTSAGISGNINYRTGDFNFFNTSGYNYREVPGQSTTLSEYFSSGSTLDEFREFDRTRKGYTTNLGLEWYINETSSLTTSVVLRDSDNESLSTNESSGTDPNNDPFQLLRIENELEDDKTIQYSLNYDKQFNGDSEHRLTFDFQYENSKENEIGIITEDSNNAERVSTFENKDEILLQTDFRKPIGEKSNFELGYRGNFNVLDTDYALEFYENGDYVLDNDVSNNLIYTEYINAVYSQFGSKLNDNFSFLLGLRLEATNIIIDQATSGDFEKKEYVGLFPTLNLGYEISEDQSITFGYNRRIRRPRSRFINPFPSRSSATNIFQGNPNIDPSYSNGIDIGYLNRFGKLTLNSSIYFTRATDVFTFIAEDTGETTLVGGTEIPIIRRTPINLATNDRFGFEFTLTYRASKDWNFNGNFNLFQSETLGDYDGINYDAKNVSWFVRFNNKYTLPGNIDWQTRVFYMGPNETAISKSKGMFSTDLAFSKDIFGENASLAFNVSDVFNTRKRASITETETFYSDSEFQWRKRTFNLSFTYRFNQQKKRQQGERNGGVDDLEFDEGT